MTQSAMRMNMAGSRPNQQDAQKRSDQQSSQKRSNQQSSLPAPPTRLPT